MELKREQIPTFDYSIAEDLFNGMFGKFKKHFKNIPTLKAKVKEHKLLKNASKVDFEGETNFRKLYARSQNKLSSIEAITKIEHEILGDELREVILLDYIGQNSGAYGLNIVSAFKLLDKNRAENLKLGILTGSLVIIPKSTKPLFDKLIKEKNLTGKILCADYDENYYRVESYGDADVVALVTEFFAQGGINVLIGTHSLLGEGWDSPCINTLVIGSVVASFMLSNQMRGRALRVDKNNPNKTANIWHLIAVESKADKGFDFKAISKRFDTFDGLNYNHDGIESGIERLGLNFANYSPDKMEELNQLSIKRAINRNNLPQKWSRCLKSGKNDKNSKIYEGLSIITTENKYIKFKKIFKIMTSPT